MPQHRAFTLIELLIVVAIIAILAAIAVPNFLEAQTRAKVSRVRADQRAITTALETYHIDNNAYVLSWQQLGRLGRPVTFNLDKFVRWRMTILTTPVSYIGTLPLTPFVAKYYAHSGGKIDITFNPGSEYDTAYLDGWYNNLGPIMAGSHPTTTRWHLRDAGPDKEFTNAVSGLTNMFPYEATNGTISIGDIWRFGP